MVSSLVKVLLSSSSSSDNQEQWQEPDQKDSMFTVCVCVYAHVQACVCLSVCVGGPEDLCEASLYFFPWIPGIPLLNEPSQ